MPDPLTIGALAASALAMAAQEVVKAAVSETVKDAYKALMDKVAHWASGEGSMLEAAPSSKGKQLAVAEIIDAQSEEDKQALRLPGGKPPSQAEGECAGNWSRRRSSDRLGDAARQGQRYKRRWRPCPRHSWRQTEDRRHFGRRAGRENRDGSGHRPSRCADHRGANHQFDRRDACSRRRCADERRPSGAARDRAPGWRVRTSERRRHLRSRSSQDCCPSRRRGHS